MKNYEIGGFLDLNPELTNSKSKGTFIKNKENLKFLMTGRQAIDYVLKDLNGIEKKALLPAYTCITVIEPFIKNGFDIIYYNVDDSLKVKTSKLNKIIKENNISVTLVHPYFGFNTIFYDEKLIAISILDKTTNFLFSDNEDSFDYVVYSLRKILPVPDGAVAKKNKGFFTSTRIQPFNEDLVYEGKKSMIDRYLYINHGLGEKNKYLQLQKKYKESLNKIDTIYGISTTSKCILENVDNEKIIKIRKENYKTLLKSDVWKRIGKVIYNNIEENECPLYFPILVDNVDRKELADYLYSKMIYPAIIWPKNDINIDKIKETTLSIYNRILAFPIDQRYCKEDMDYILLNIENFLGEKNEK